MAVRFTGTLAMLLLALALLLAGTGNTMAPQTATAQDDPAVPIDPDDPATWPPAIDYDKDDDGLIEITTLAQLNAITWATEGT